jgi:outer membrane biosynthesis protein TonB
MSGAKIAIRGGATPGSEETGPKRNRTRQFLVLTLGAGAVSGIVALVGPALVTNVGAAITTHVAVATPQPIQATQLFPAVPPQHQVINVYDPPPPAKVAPAPPAPTAASHPTPSPEPRRSPRPTPSGSPRPSPPPDN